MNSQNSYAAPTADPQSSNVIEANEHGLGHRVVRQMGITGGIVACIGAFASSLNYFQQNRVAWAITALGSGCMMIGALLHSIRNRATTSANQPMHGSGEVGGVEVENLSSPPRDR
jgi:hypothetical protein